MIASYQVLAAIHIGLIYVILAVPLTLSYKATKIINFVHINFITYGAYAAVLFYRFLGVRNVFVAVAVAFLVGGLISVIDNIVVFEPLGKRGANVVILMIASMGLWIFYKYMLYSMLDALSRASKINLISQSASFEGLRGVEVGGLTLTSSFLTTIVIAGAALLGLYIVLEKTAVGKAIRAIADNPRLAEVSGIPRGRVLNVMWFIAGGLAAMGGVLWLLFARVTTPEVGDTLILRIFAIAVIGGLDSLLLTAVGGFIISFAENLGMAVLNQAFGVSTSFTPFITFATLLIVIIAFPPMGAGGGLPYRFLRRPRRGEEK